MLEALRTAIDDGDASPDAKGDAFARVRRKLKLVQSARDPSLVERPYVTARA
jgi:hypothetical protein